MCRLLDMKKLFGIFLSFVLALAPISAGQATLVDLPAPIAYPGIANNISTSPTLSTVATVDAAGEYVAYIFSARENMVVSHVGFRAGTATGSPTAEVRIETVDAAGLPSGTLWATNTNGTTGTVTTNSNPLQALTASASITKGQVFCVKIVYASGTSLIIQQLAGHVLFGVSGLPYQVINTGTPTKTAVTTNPLIAFGSSATTFYNVPGTMPLSAIAGATFNNTNSAKRGLKFTLPMNARIIGLRFWAVSSVGDFNAAIFDSSGAVVGSSSTAYDGDQNANTTSGMTYVYFTNPVTATAGTAYYAAIEPTSATNANMPVITLPTSDYFTSTPAGTTAVYSAFATSSWTDSTTQLPVLDIIIDQVDNGAGSGGGGGRIIGG